MKVRFVGGAMDGAEVTINEEVVTLESPTAGKYCLAGQDGDVFIFLHVSLMKLYKIND